MKMAEKSVMLTFQNNCESINSNCVEVRDAESDTEKITNSDITHIVTNINKQPEDEPIIDRKSATTEEDAVEQFLAGDLKSDFHDDLLLEDLKSGNEGIDFKSDNVIMDCPDFREKTEFFDNDEDEGEEDAEGDDDKNESEVSPEPNSEDVLDEESPVCLTKMQIMEDVREGCNIQPSSPGHAEERTTESEKVEENGFGEESVTAVDEDAKKEVDLVEDGKDEKGQENGDVEKGENNSESNQNEESSSSEESINNKRKAEGQESSVKKLRLDIQDNFISRDKILNEFIEMAECSTIEQIQAQTEQILAEIRTLNEMAKDKEREWNNIIHLKKMKEELLLRMQRRKQVMLLNGDKSENGDILFGESPNDGLMKHQSILKANLTNPNRTMRISNIGGKQRTILPKPVNYSQELNGLDYRQNKQRNILDVQSIIADYRQRHPETVPRRGRRIRNAHLDAKGNNQILNFSSLALGSGSQVHHNMDVNSELGLLLNAMDSNRTDCSRPSSVESSHIFNEPSFKDMLVQFAKLSQSERHELIQNAIKPPPPYPEVTVHPVPTTTTAAPTNSLLHGILTKSPPKTNSKSSFSPTLARLLTAPERSNSHSPTAPMTHPANMSISEILSTSKARNEITITPVGSQYDSPVKTKGGQDEDEAEDSADRLVIDESTEILDGRARGDNSSDAGDEVPQCQGCNQKSALFVCAGCGNQWYCSRECQVSAWDEHSEVCSG